MRTRLQLLWSCVVAGSLLSACGGDDGPTATQPTTTSPPASAPTTTGDGRAALAPGEEWFAYQESVDDRQQVFLIRPDGTGRHPLASDLGAGHQTNPDWSPAGDRLVLAVGDGSTDDLWVA